MHVVIRGVGLGIVLVAQLLLEAHFPRLERLDSMPCPVLSPRLNKRITLFSAPFAVKRSLAGLFVWLITPLWLPWHCTNCVTEVTITIHVANDSHKNMVNHYQASPMQIN